MGRGISCPNADEVGKMQANLEVLEDGGE